LNSNGIFRSDDAGRHWIAVDAGLPLKGKRNTPHPVLFRRGGALWITDSQGTDPGVLTVDRDVTRATLSPDGAAAAYVSADGDTWAVRVLSASGSAARTVATGSGETPQLRWSPTSALLAIVQAQSVRITNLAHRTWRWTFPSDEHLLGWSASGRGLMFWKSNNEHVSLRSWTTGRVSMSGEERYRSAPLPAPDGKHVAYLLDGKVYLGSWGGSARQAAPIPSHCRLRSWSDDSTRLLLACGTDLRVLPVAGGPARQVAVPSNATWVPGSNTDLLFFRGGDLWRWTPPSHVFRIVHTADPLQ
jgi:hypothetical protein